MPKRKPADVNVEPAAETRKRAPGAKPKTAAAATHKRTTRKATAEVAAVAAEPAPESIPSAPVQPTQAAIAALAYSYWEARGWQPGDPVADWLRAERELTKLAQNR